MRFDDVYFQKHLFNRREAIMLFIKIIEVMKHNY